MIRAINRADPQTFQPGFFSGDTSRRFRSTAIEPKPDILVP